MKKQITILTAITLFIAMTMDAKVWRVNNRTNVQADFTTLSSAISGASAGDTIYIEGSPDSYGNAGYVAKQLTIIGAGYFLNENDSSQVFKESSKIDHIIFYNGSQGSIIEGVTILGTTNYGITINTDDITVRRNNISVNYPYGNANAIKINSGRNSIVIEQNWIEPGISTYTNRGIYFTTYTISTIIRNNIILTDTSDFAIFMNEENPTSTLTIANNTIKGDIETYYSAHYNNILIDGTYTAGTGDVSSSNLCNATQYSNANGNVQNVDMTTVFTDHTSTNDNGYVLKTGSPAEGAGLNGEDCGAYGTNNPYVPAGIPPIPAIFGFEISQSIGSPTIPVTIKAMSHK
jgi:hypothetical protein